MELYFLSIIDGINVFIIALGAVFVALAILVFANQDNIADEDRGFFIKKMKQSFILGVFIIFIAALIPTQKSLMKSHLMLEGKDVITSENVDKLMENIDEKIDKIIERK